LPTNVAPGICGGEAKVSGARPGVVQEIRMALAKARHSSAGRFIKPAIKR
jgi:hypothetical protein